MVDVPTRTAREDSGHEHPVPRQPVWADGIDAAVHAAQAMKGGAVLSAAGPEPERPELSDRDDAVLAGGEVR